MYYQGTGGDGSSSSSSRSSSSGCTIRAHTGGDGARGFCRSLTISLTQTILAEVSLGSASEGGGGVMDF